MDYMLFVCRHHIALIGCGREEGEVRMILSGKGKGRCLSGQTSFYYCIYSFTESSFGMEQQITWLQLNQSLIANVLRT